MLLILLLLLMIRRVEEEDDSGTICESWLCGVTIVAKGCDLIWSICMYVWKQLQSGEASSIPVYSLYCRAALGHRWGYAATLTS
jgi:hypothetical protein